MENEVAEQGRQCQIQREGKIDYYISRHGTEAEVDNKREKTIVHTLAKWCEEYFHEYVAFLPAIFKLHILIVIKRCMIRNHKKECMAGRVE